MAEARKPILLRISPQLWEEVSRVAQSELRSVNAQIEFMIRESLRRRKAGGEEEPRAARGDTGNNPQA